MIKYRKGFTLIELLVVIAIIGILSTLAVVALNSARQRSRDAKRVADIKQIQTALELGFSDTSGYPLADAVMGSATASVLCKTGAEAAWQDSIASCGGGTIFMGKIPANVIPNGVDYHYYADTTTPGLAYQILFNLEGDTGALSAGDNCANNHGVVSGSAC